MIKKVIISLLFISIVLVFFLSLNEFNTSARDRKFINEHTPVKFAQLINDFEEIKFENTQIVVKNLRDNIYRQYMMTPDFYGFIVGTMGYEEEMLVYIELEYLNDFIQVNHVEILYENETDGYGDYVVEPWFLDRFKQVMSKEIQLVKRKKTKDNQVIAITGATITSEAIVTALNNCRQIMEDSKDENE